MLSNLGYQGPGHEYVFMQNKVFLDDIIAIPELCAKKCINNYNSPNLNTQETLCLEKCFFKTIDLNNHITNQLPNMFPKLDVDLNYERLRKEKII